MDNPFFLVIHRFYHVIDVCRVPYTLLSSDAVCFSDYDKAKGHAVSWLVAVCDSFDVRCDWGVLTRASCRIDDVCFDAVSVKPFDSLYSHVGVTIFQKYVL